jgi:hypothetical protein
MATATTTQEQDMTTTESLSIRIARAQLALTKSYGQDRFLPGVYDRLIAGQEARLVERLSAASQEVAA